VLNVTMNERTTVKRSIYPQGHLTGLMQSLRDDGLDLEQFVVAVNLDDPWFQRRKLTVISRGDFAADGISSINVHLSYGGEPQNLLLESSGARAEVEWASILDGGAMRRPVTARYSVLFKDSDGAERPVELHSAEETVDVDFLEINPRELYAIVPVPVVALGFPFERYPQVEVQLQYDDEANGIRLDDTLVLTKERPEQLWKLFVRDRARTAFRYKLTLRGAESRDLVLPWVTSDEERVSVRDPRPNKRTLSIAPNLDFAQVERAFVDVRYMDPEHDIFAEESFEFSESDKASKTFRVDLVNPERRAVDYKVTLLFKQNRLVLEVPPSVTLDRRIVVRSDMRGHRLVRVRPEAVGFAARRLRELRVQVRYEDAESGLSFADSFGFRSAQDAATFEFDYVDEQKDAIEYRVDYLYTNGMVRSTEWTPGGGDELVVPIV
jgi:hypothetical protein